MRFKPYYITIIAAIALIAAACTPPENSEKERSPGQTAFQSYCQTCHSLPKPSMKSDIEWPPLVKRYGTRAKLSNEKIAIITDYLVSVN